jgi:hypothetical protein
MRSGFAADPRGTNATGEVFTRLGVQHCMSFSSRCASFSFAVALTLPVAARAQTARDQSTAARVAGVGIFDFEARVRERRHFHGAIERIEPPTVDAGAGGGVGHVVLAGAEPESARTLRMYFEPTLRAPFRVGEVIDADVDCTVGGFHFVCDSIVRDATGSLILAVIGSGRRDLLSDWTISDGAVFVREQDPNIHGHSVRMEFALAFTHRGRTGISRGTRWKQLVTPDGTFVFRGSGVRWEGLRPSEGVDYSTYAITRVR